MTQSITNISVNDSFLVREGTTHRVYLIPTDGGIVQSHFLRGPPAAISK